MDNKNVNDNVNLTTSNEQSYITLGDLIKSILKIDIIMCYNSCYNSNRSYLYIWYC